MSELNKIDALYEKCKASNRKAQKRLYELTAAKMLAVCLRYASCQAEAEDILQTGYMNVFVNISSFKKQGSFEGWIRKIMVNAAIDNFRKRKDHLHHLDIAELSPEESPEVNLEELELQDLLGLIQQLPNGYRIVFNMYVIEGYSHREIAQELNIQESTSKSQLQRARIWLQKKIRLQEGEIYGSQQEQA